MKRERKLVAFEMGLKLNHKLTEIDSAARESVVGEDIKTPTFSRVSLSFYVSFSGKAFMNGMLAGEGKAV